MSSIPLFFIASMKGGKLFTTASQSAYSTASYSSQLITDINIRVSLLLFLKVQKGYHCMSYVLTQVSSYQPTNWS